MASPRSNLHPSLRARHPHELADSFWERVAPHPNGACWLWTGHTHNGYGRIGVRYGPRCENRQAHLSAHVLAWAIEHGRWPKLCIIHSCDNPPCVNPDHLREATHQENMHDVALRLARPASATATRSSRRRRRRGCVSCTGTGGNVR